MNRNHNLKDLEPIGERRGNIEKGEKPSFYYLFVSLCDNTFWECQPIFDEENMYYSGGPTRYVKVSNEYVKEHYGDVGGEMETGK